MNELDKWFEKEAKASILERRTLSGGDICDTQRLVTDDGRNFCVNQQPAAPHDFFMAEADGLRTLARSQTLRVPQVYAAEPGFILMEYLEPGPRAPDYWDKLGQGLAKLHSQRAPCFGFERDNYCGRTPQPNPRQDSGYRFFAEQRLLYQGQLALEQDFLSGEDYQSLEALCQRLPDLIPDQSPALLHGDLWGGNIHTDATGQPVLIDPACYWGWPEADIAMTRLFGGFGERFYQAYLEAHPLEPGWEQRLPLYNLYHLLNHLNLFGGSYYPQVIQTIRRFS